MLEKQALEVLGQIKISQKFVDWAIKWLNETNKDQQSVREDRSRALRSAYDGVVQRLDNLLNLKLSPHNLDGRLITDEEFVNKKNLLLEEKTRIQAQLNDLDKHVTDWITLAEKTFNFAATAQERFEKGSIEDKKTIMRAIGSNLLLRDKKLEVELRTPFLLIKEAINQIDNEKRSAPEEKLDITQRSENLDLQNKIWGGRRVPPPRPPGPQPGALLLSYIHQSTLFYQKIALNTTRM